jgi:hypothetical protein
VLSPCHPFITTTATTTTVALQAVAGELFPLLETPEGQIPWQTAVAVIVGFVAGLGLMFGLDAAMDKCNPEGDDEEEKSASGGDIDIEAGGASESSLQSYSSQGQRSLPPPSSGSLKKSRMILVRARTRRATERAVARRLAVVSARVPVPAGMPACAVCRLA